MIEIDSNKLKRNFDELTDKFVEKLVRDYINQANPGQIAEKIEKSIADQTSYWLNGDRFMRDLTGSVSQKVVELVAQRIVDEHFESIEKMIDLKVLASLATRKAAGLAAQG